MSKYNKKKKYIAAFEGLVDIVSYKGEPAFLVKSGDKLSIELKVKLDKKTHYPPPANKTPWLLPNGEKIIEHYEAMRKTSESDRNKAIFEELVQYHKAASELPSEELFYSIWLHMLPRPPGLKIMSAGKGIHEFSRQIWIFGFYGSGNFGSGSRICRG